MVSTGVHRALPFDAVIALDGTTPKGSLRPPLNVHVSGIAGLEHLTDVFANGEH